MTETEWREFLAAGTRTGKLATTRLDGRPHVVPIWFALDGDDLVFNTGADTVKGRSLVRTGWACLCVDDQSSPFSFVTVSGPVAISTDLDEMLPWATRIAARYMGDERAEQFGRRNAVEGELLLRLRAAHVAAVVTIQVPGPWLWGGAGEGEEGSWQPGWGCLVRSRWRPAVVVQFAVG